MVKKKAAKRTGRKIGGKAGGYAGRAGGAAAGAGAALVVTAGVGVVTAGVGAVVVAAGAVGCGCSSPSPATVAMVAFVASSLSASFSACSFLSTRTLAAALDLSFACFITNRVWLWAFSAASFLFSAASSSFCSRHFLTRSRFAFAAFAFAAFAAFVWWPRRPARPPARRGCISTDSIN